MGNLKSFLDYSGYKCVSGGASGSDELFASLFSHTLIVSFAGHHVSGKCNYKMLVGEEDFSSLKVPCEKIASDIGRKLSAKYWRFQARDLRQVKISKELVVDFVLAIGSLESNNLVVSGGTAYATETAKRLGVPLFLIDKVTLELRQWNNGTWSLISFEELKSFISTRKLFCGVGSREIDLRKKEIRELIIKLFS